MRPRLLLIALAACTGPAPKDSADTDDTSPTDDTGPTGLDAATVPLHGECAPPSDFGGFALTVTDEASDLSGSVADGVVPTSVLEELVAEGDCMVARRNNPFCDPGCDPGYTCDFDGTCVPYPANQDLGTVTLDGLASLVAMEPVFPGNTYFDTSLAHPAVTGGELLTLEMLAGTYGPTTLHGVGVEPLVVTEAVWTIESGVDLTVHWTAPTGAVSRGEVVMRVSIDQHGVSPSSLRCVFADDGEGTVPGTVLARLVDVGVTGFPSATLERRTIDQAPAGAGCQDFAVRSPRGVDVDVVGHTPCVSDNECPKGQECNEELQTCE